MGAANPTVVKQLAMEAGEVVDFHGIGLGALAGGKGEFVLLDGSGWSTDSDGNVSELGPGTSLFYFGVMSHYAPTGQAPLANEVSCLSNLKDLLNEKVGTDQTERMAVFKLEGRFDSVKFVYDDPFHPKPTTLTDVSGTIVGTKSGAYVTGDAFTSGGIEIGLTEYPFHAHFVADDRSTVGHVLDCKISQGTVEWALADTYDLRLPFSGEAAAGTNRVP
jgi:alpha-acetolactate decarboxylase